MTTQQPSKHGGTYPPWSEDDLKTLRELYPKTKTATLAGLINRTETAIRAKAHELGVPANKSIHHSKTNDVWRSLALTDTEKAYIAGIIDGEGSISLTRHRTNYGRTKIYIYILPRVAVANTNRDLIDWLKHLLGGHVRVNHPTNPRYKPCYYWILQGNLMIKALLVGILPYLIIKKDKAEEVLSHKTTHESDDVQWHGRPGRPLNTVAEVINREEARRENHPLHPGSCVDRTLDIPS